MHAVHNSIFIAISFQKFVQWFAMDNLSIQEIQVKVFEFLNCCWTNHVFVLSTFYLGGPLIRQDDEVLVGITSSIGSVPSGFIFKKYKNLLNTFTNVHYYFDWINEKTELNLPSCVYSLAGFPFL